MPSHKPIRFVIFDSRTEFNLNAKHYLKIVYVYPKNVQNIPHTKHGLIEISLQENMKNHTDETINDDHQKGQHFFLDRKIYI